MALRDDVFIPRITDIPTDHPGASCDSLHKSIQSYLIKYLFRCTHLVVTKRYAMLFEWDIEKNLSNQRKHHISFETAARVFLDPLRLEIFDREHSSKEERWKTIGIVEAVVLVVIYTERGEANEIIRIISARKANADERKSYNSF